MNFYLLLLMKVHFHNVADLSHLDLISLGSRYKHRCNKHELAPVESRPLAFEPED